MSILLRKNGRELVEKKLSWEKISKPSDTHHEGDKVKVKVIGRDKGKLGEFEINKLISKLVEEIKNRT